MALTKSKRRERIKRRVRKHISGTAQRPRLTVFRSNKQIYAQVIDDISGVTIASAASLKNDDANKVNKTEQAKLVGKLLADRASGVKVTNVVFDRGGFLYHGRVKALADSAREAGLKF